VDFEPRIQDWHFQNQAQQSRRKGIRTMISRLSIRRKLVKTSNTSIDYYRSLAGVTLQQCGWQRIRKGLRNAGIFVLLLTNPTEMAVASEFICLNKDNQLLRSCSGMRQTRTQDFRAYLQSPITASRSSLYEIDQGLFYCKTTTWRTSVPSV
jgi:hypothetical protein